MALTLLDWSIIAAFMIASLLIGVLVAKRAGRSSADFFLSGRSMPWWLLGASMVATTFSTDTPNLVTDIVRGRAGVAGNWVWWAFLLSGMLTTFVYARLWRRSGAMTDIEFYELRYSGKLAAVLRGFRAIYISFYVLISMAAVSLAAIKIFGVLLGFSAWQTVLIGGVIVVAYSGLGGLRSVLFTDFFQLAFALIGAFAAAWYALAHPDVGGLRALLRNEAVIAHLPIIPDLTNPDLLIPLLIMPLAVHWWALWYPGSEPGGGGYIVQRMLSAKNERHALGATLFFNVTHYAIRPWPWILVALASLVVFPDLDALRRAFPHVDQSKIGNDLAYSAMLTFLPQGLAGMVAASLMAAYMSTMSTNVNLISSYLVNDVYRRFIRPEAPERRLVWLGRITTVLVMALAGLIALGLNNALQAFQVLLQIGAGTGLLFILRWFWWRINAFSELTAMAVSLLIALYFTFLHPSTGAWALAPWQQLLIAVVVTTAAWMAVTLLTSPADKKTLRRFYRLVQPGGPGWAAVVRQAKEEGDALDNPRQAAWDVPRGIVCMLLGSVAIYAALFAAGNWIYSRHLIAILLTLVAVLAGATLWRISRKLVLISKPQPAQPLESIGPVAPSEQLSHAR